MLNFVASLDNICNMDETGLFFRLIPNKQVVSICDAIRICFTFSYNFTAYEAVKGLRGTKSMKAKDRIT